MTQPLYGNEYKLKATIFSKDGMPGVKDGSELVLEVVAWAADLRTGMRNQLAVLEEQFPDHAIEITPAGDDQPPRVTMGSRAAAAK